MSKATDYVLMALLAISISLNVVFIARARADRDRLPLSGVPAIGTTVPDLQLETLGGDPITLGRPAPGRGRLIYVFAPKCSWCVKNLSNVQKLFAGLKDRYDIVVLATTKDGLEEYLASNPFDAPVYMVPDLAVRASYGIGATPQTIIVDGDGAVRYHWRGAYGRRVVRHIESELAVLLAPVGDLP